MHIVNWTLSLLLVLIWVIGNSNNNTKRMRLCKGTTKLLNVPISFIQDARSLHVPTYLRPRSFFSVPPYLDLLPTRSIISGIQLANIAYVPKKKWPGEKTHPGSMLIGQWPWTSLKAIGDSGQRSDGLGFPEHDLGFPEPSGPLSTLRRTRPHAGRDLGTRGQLAKHAIYGAIFRYLLPDCRVPPYFGLFPTISVISGIQDANTACERQNQCARVWARKIEKIEIEKCKQLVSTQSTNQRTKTSNNPVRVMSEICRWKSGAHT